MMKIIAVVGTGSGCGKTTVACRILREFPGLGAVKISPRDGGVSRVEWAAGEPGKDTDLFVGSGAVPVARIIGPRGKVGASWDLIKAKFDGCRGVVMEGASSLEIPGERFVVFVSLDTNDDKREERNRAMAQNSSVIVDRLSHLGVESHFDAIRSFLAGSSNEKL